jgi:hypothetical protein
MNSGDPRAGWRRLRHQWKRDQNGYDGPHGQARLSHTVYLRHRHVGAR